MRGFAFRTGLSFEWSGVRHRIDRLSTNEQVVLERLDDGQIVLCQRSDLLSAFVDGAINVQAESTDAAQPHFFGRPLSDLPENLQVEVRRRLAYLRAVEDAGVDAFSERFLSPVIAMVASEICDPKPPSWISVYRWHRKYRSAKETRALIPRFDMRGQRDLRQSERVLELFAQAAEEAFKASPAAFITTIHTRLTGKIHAENRIRLPEEQLVVPNQRTSYRLFARIQAYDQTRLKEGKAAADRRYKIAKVAPQPTRILERVEADHTPLDLFLIDEHSGLPQGRPILTVFNDTFSRFPLGYFLNFSGTSAMAVMGALRHAILPKQPVKELIPNLRIKHAWPCYGVMDNLALDNGLEFHGTALDGVAMDLGIDLLFCPKRQPWFKGKVERYLKTLNYSFCHQMPGTSLARLADRGDYDPQKHAVLTMAEFKHVLEKWLLDIYAQSPHRGIRTTPWAKWHEGLKSRTPELPGSIDDLQRRIGLVDERKLQRDGVTLDGIRYTGPSLDPIMRAWGPGVKLRIVYDAEDLGQIQVWAPEQQDPVSVLAVDQGYAKNLTAAQHKMIQEQLREDGKNVNDLEELQQAKYDLAISIDQLQQSRKQVARRRGAKLHGVTSNRPEARLQAQPPEKTKSKPVFTSSSEDEAPTPLPTFRLRSGGL